MQASVAPEVEGAVCLLDPRFDGSDLEPGYIRTTAR